jgi:hypothetical protein
MAGILRHGCCRARSAQPAAASMVRARVALGHHIGQRLWPCGQEASAQQTAHQTVTPEWQVRGSRWWELLLPQDGRDPEQLSGF